MIKFNEKWVSRTIGDMSIGHKEVISGNITPNTLQRIDIIIHETRRGCYIRKTFGNGRTTLKHVNGLLEAMDYSDNLIKALNQ